MARAEHLRRIDGLRGEMVSTDEDERFAARTKVMGALHDLVRAMTFFRRSRLVGLELADDGYVVGHPYGEGIAAGYASHHPGSPNL